MHFENSQVHNGSKGISMGSWANRCVLTTYLSWKTEKVFGLRIAGDEIAWAIRFDCFCYAIVVIVCCLSSNTHTHSRIQVVAHVAPQMGQLGTIFDVVLKRNVVP